MTDTDNLVKWLNKELSNLLEFDIGEEYAKNIIKIDTESEIREFLSSLLDLSLAKNKAFLNELLAKLNKPSQMDNITIYNKNSDAVEEIFKMSNPKKQANKNANDAARAKTTPVVETKPKKQSTFSLQPTNQASEKPYNRVRCECQATEHKLIGNCLSCGRISCEREGSGPCYFCGHLVCTHEEMEKIKRGSNKGEKLHAELMSRSWRGVDALASRLEAQTLSSPSQNDENDEEKLRKAIEHKNKLIEFDRMSAKRTQVIDDESDYFNTNSKWLSEQQRRVLEKKEKELRDKRFASRLENTTITFDFAGRKVVEADHRIDYEKYMREAEQIQAETTPHGGTVSSSTALVDSINAVIANPSVKQKPTFIDDKKNKKHVNPKQADSDKSSTSFRIQDTLQQEMKDDGMCLSMHQPWASLLVNGIKKHEGRTWYTPYRGRLWIHAGSKEPTEQDIRETETFYKCYYSDHNMSFPETYPTSCLIGYVDLTDCLSSESYKQQYPNGESESDFVFICENPYEMAVKLPMSGQHKIFKLDKSIHASAKKVAVY